LGLKRSCKYNFSLWVGLSWVGFVIYHRTYTKIKICKKHTIGETKKRNLELVEERRTKW